MWYVIPGTWYRYLVIIVEVVKSTDAAVGDVFWSIPCLRLFNAMSSFRLGFTSQPVLLQLVLSPTNATASPPSSHLLIYPANPVHPHYAHPSSPPPPLPPPMQIRS